MKWELMKAVASTRYTRIKIELNNFALQFLHYDINITAGGIFIIDSPLIFKMVGACCTYVVILVQFDLAFASIKMTVPETVLNITLVM
ncbi:hypothetical protein FQR65_LT00676 [Abscondita terminalis]|nr:hypothetical protein FQR65_LT00676 [Abscondita terminalis]